MTPIEANAVLTYAALLDSRMKRNDPVERADMAEAWAAGLTKAGVTVDAARAAVDAHYASSREALMLADLVAAAGVVESLWVDRTDEALAEVARKQLAVLGTTPEEYRADPAVRLRVDAVLDAREIEEA